MVSEGDEVNVMEFGLCKLNSDGKHTIYLIEEEEDSINWTINPDYQRESVLTSRKADLINKEG